MRARVFTRNGKVNNTSGAPLTKSIFFDLTEKFGGGGKATKLGLRSRKTKVMKSGSWNYERAKGERTTLLNSRWDARVWGLRRWKVRNLRGSILLNSCQVFVVSMFVKWVSLIRWRGVRCRAICHFKCLVIHWTWRCRLLFFSNSQPLPFSYRNSVSVLFGGSLFRIFRSANDRARGIGFERQSLIFFSPLPFSFVPSREAKSMKDTPRELWTRRRGSTTLNTVLTKEVPTFYSVAMISFFEENRK